MSKEMVRRVNQNQSYERALSAFYASANAQKQYKENLASKKYKLDVMKLFTKVNWVGLIVHEEGCDAIRCTCNRPKTLKDVIEELEKKREETEKPKVIDDYGCA